jgi:hypothetical protein
MSTTCTVCNGAIPEGAEPGETCGWACKHCPHTCASVECANCGAETPRDVARRLHTDNDPEDSWHCPTCAEAA